ncbi:MAG: sigma-54-dependent Fis family transcriptional regulator [Nitrospirales bacterium]|nr:sigma-54-dependent Fis family transcriptional regulator [Nitrospirales bacterium]
MKSVLVADDDPQMRAALHEAVRRLGHEAVLAENGQEALAKLSHASFALVITDMKMPKMDGLTFLKEVRRRGGNLPVLVITGYGTIENAVETMKEGATDYLLKPFSFDTLTKKIDSIMERISSGREIITESPSMKRALQIASAVAASDTTVLIYGESGTGKELLARYIFNESLRREKPFVAVNCAAIPDNLMESELFGFEKGAFTGATEKKPGKFELAGGGTILLDEIGEMPMPLQAKLLRVLQEKEVDRIGGRQPIPIDVRVIATTNRDLYKEALEGRFREDLYYRLSVFPIHVPPLRERQEDIPILASHFLKKYASRQIGGVSAAALEMLRTRQWRGNIRELENTMQRAALLCREEMVEPQHFMFSDEPGPQPLQSQGGIREMEKELIMKTLKEMNGNKTKAAKALGVSVRTIRNKLNEYGKIFPGEECKA